MTTENDLRIWINSKSSTPASTLGYSINSEFHRTRLISSDSAHQHPNEP